MKYIKLIFLLFTFLTAGFTFARNGKILPLSLEKALEMAQKQSYQIQIARSQVSQAKGQNLEAWSGFMPRISISENYMKSNDPVTVFGLKLKQGVFSEVDFNLSALNNPDAFDNFTTTFQMQQPLLNFDAIYGKSAAKLGVQARAEALNRTEEMVVLQVKKAYYGLILTRGNLTAIEGAVESATVHRDDAKAAFEEGLINQADYLAAEVRLAELQEQRISAGDQVANASDGLKFVMGIEEESFIVPTDSLEVPSQMQFEEYGQEQVKTRSDLRALQLQSRAARRNVWMKRSNWIPRLNAFGAIEWNASEAFRKDASNWVVGLQLQWRLFDGLGNFGRTKQAAAQAEEVAVQYRQAEEKAKMEIRQAQRTVQTAKQRIQVAQAAVKQASESLRIVEERFREGLEKTSDLLDKEVTLTNTRLRLLKARHDYAVAASVLQFALGL